MLMRDTNTLRSRSISTRRPQLKGGQKVLRRGYLGRKVKCIHTVRCLDEDETPPARSEAEGV